MSTPDESVEPGERYLIEAMRTLGEHYESVRIFVNYTEGDETRSRTLGKGNFCAQLGQIAEWLEVQKQYQRNVAIRRDKEE